MQFAHSRGTSVGHRNGAKADGHARAVILTLYSSVRARSAGELMLLGHKHACPGVLQCNGCAVHCCAPATQAASARGLTVSLNNPCALHIVERRAAVTVSVAAAASNGHGGDGGGTEHGEGVPRRQRRPASTAPPVDRWPGRTIRGALTALACDMRRQEEQNGLLRG